MVASRQCEILLMIPIHEVQSKTYSDIARGYLDMVIFVQETRSRKATIWNMQ